VINIAFLRLDKIVPGWDSDQVKIKKTIVFNPDDPRVELSNNASTYTREEVMKDHAPVITRDEVGYLFVRFALDRILPLDTITVTISCRIGQRKDTITVTKANQKNAIWEVFSDKYLNETSFQYELQVDVSGTNFTDEPVHYSTAQAVTVPLPTGRVK